MGRSFGGFRVWAYATIDQLVGNDPTLSAIVGIQRWSPVGNIEFADNPLNPIDSGSQWTPAFS
jgi:hypothetical protein